MHSYDKSGIKTLLYPLVSVKWGRYNDVHSWTLSSPIPWLLQRTAYW